MIQNITQPPLILASSSPRRRQLLSRLSIPFRIIDSDVEEDLSSDSSPAATASGLALRKAQTVAASLPYGIVLAADTVIDSEGRLLGKPRNGTDALTMLRLLRGRWHQVITAVAVVDAAMGKKLNQFVSTQVLMNEYPEEFIASYMETGEPYGKAGSYAIQGKGSRLVATIRGCYNNVIGLPLCETVTLLKNMGLPLVEKGDICRLPTGEPCPRVRRDEVR